LEISLKKLCFWFAGDSAVKFQRNIERTDA